jgi:hypothetical protein
MKNADKPDEVCDNISQKMEWVFKVLAEQEKKPFEVNNKTINIDRTIQILYI